MNDGILFYWFMWIGWVVTTFLIERNPFRNAVIFILLPGIIMSGYDIPFSLGSVNAAFAYFLIIGLVHVIRSTGELLYYLAVSFIIAVSYVTIQIFALYDPAKLFIDKKYLLIIFLSAVLFLISKRNIDLFYIPLIGIFIGDTLYQLLIFRLTGYLEIGSMFVLDLLASSTMILFCMVILVDMFKKLRRVSYKKVNPAKQI
ncbi:hypothetical protein ACFW35_08230 [Fictibacillus sp. NPDC058756]|uniref:YphA family membrane protein n=1 Tax=Fictibacillus sp. NPDC058756 TaxID=3346625 RepID=UPI00369B8C71